MAEESDQREDREQRPGDDERGSEQPSETDAMGRDKRRSVVGGQYGATVRKQLTVYGTFLAVTAAILIAGFTVVRDIDNAEIPLEDTAPWTEAAAAQSAPRDVDFPRNGPDNTIPRDEIGKAAPASDSDPRVGR